MARPFALAGARAIVATMHGKTPVIAAALAPTGLVCVPASGLDTDAFGTFTRTVARAGDQRAALVAKAQAALARDRTAAFAIASEGAFGPHPAFGLVPAGFEMVGLVERASGACVIGHSLCVETNHAGAACDSVAAALDFAATARFPGHGLIVRTHADGAIIAADCADDTALARVVGTVLADHGRVWLETDMRAHRNPTRMRAIGAAARDLAARLGARCPRCATPDFTPRAETGRPCADCGGPTHAVWRMVATCAACGYHDARVDDPERLADPGLCPECNP